MVKGREETGVRGSISVRVFIVGPGGPGGVRVPCPTATGGRQAAENRRTRRDFVIIGKCRDGMPASPSTTVFLSRGVRGSTWQSHESIEPVLTPAKPAG